MSFHTTVSSKNSFQKKSGFVGCFAAIPRVRPSDMHSQAMPHRRSRSNGICDRTLSTFYAEIRPGYNSWVGSIGILPFQAFQPSLSIINLGHFWHTGLEKLLHECFVKEQRSGQDMQFLKTTSMRKEEKCTLYITVLGHVLSNLPTRGGTRLGVCLLEARVDCELPGNPKSNDQCRHFRISHSPVWLDHVPKPTRGLQTVWLPTSLPSCHHHQTN